MKALRQVAAGLRRVLPAALAVILAGLLAWGALTLGRADGAGEPRASLELAEVLGGADTAGHARALAPRPFRFPEDHGPHPDFRSEWWYLTANLENRDGRRFGVQLTIFRSAVAPPPVDGAQDASGRSAWATRQVYLGHLAVTDVAGRRHRAHERFARGALGLAGASADPLRVWVEGWSLEGGLEAIFPLRVRAAAEGEAVDLTLRRGKPPVLQGDRGLSPKGPEPGNASFYYSFTRLPAAGTLSVGGEAFEVSGLAWMDREWSTSALGPDLAGWDWFGLQMSDGRDLMFYRLRRKDGRASPFSSGVLVEEDGRSLRLDAGDVTLEVLERWSSPVDGTRYPSRWRLTVPGRGISLALTPLVPSQEMNLALRYWEGAVSLEGRGPRGRVEGFGYMELTGYDGSDRARPDGGP